MVTSTHTNGKPQTPEDYWALGLLPIPVPHRTKICPLDDWSSFRRESVSLETLFPDDGQKRGVGVMLGAASGRLVDVDLDSSEALAAAPHLLPPTGWVFGRKSKPSSHWEYRTIGRPAKTHKYTDLRGKTLVELRGDKHMTVYPPSVHEEGEPIVWERFESPGELLTEELEIAVAQVAGASLLARHWPDKGSRHDCRLMLAGGLLRAGFTEDAATNFLVAVTTAAKNQGVADCHKVVSATKRKLDAEEDVRGWPSLAKLVGNEVVKTVCQWLGIKGTIAAEPADVPVPTEPPWPDPPGAEAYYGLPGRIVRTIGPSSEADETALLVQSLLMFGNNIDRSAYFVVEDDRHHPNEYTVMIGKTSKGRKGTSWGRIIRLFAAADEEWATHRVQSGLSSGEGLIWSVRDAIVKREKVSQGKGQPPAFEDVEAGMLILATLFPTCNGMWH